MQPEINAARIQNLWQNTKSFKDVLLAVVVKEIVERRKSAEIDEEARNKAILEVEQWWEDKQEEKKRNAKLNITSDELTTQLLVQLGTIKSQIASTFEAQQAKNAQLNHQVDQNFGDTKPTEITTLMETLSGRDELYFQRPRRPADCIFKTPSPNN